METRQELEQEVKTLRYLRREHLKDAVVESLITLSCYAEAGYAWVEQQRGLALFAGALALIGTIPSSKNIIAYRNLKGDLREAHKKLDGLENSLY